MTARIPDTITDSQHPRAITAELIAPLRWCMFILRLARYKWASLWVIASWGPAGTSPFFLLAAYIYMSDAAKFFAPNNPTGVVTIVLIVFFALIVFGGIIMMGIVLKRRGEIFYGTKLGPATEDMKIDEAAGAKRGFIRPVM